MDHLVQIAMADLIVVPECQSRSELQNDAIDEYAEHISDLPPIDVFLVNGAPYVVDGYHRFSAHAKAGSAFIHCRIVGKGTINDAAWRAAAANLSHGVRRTHKDKRKAVLLALECGIGVDQSNAIIAEHVGVSLAFVHCIRKELEGARHPQGQGFIVEGCANGDSVTAGNAESVESTADPPKRLGRDGKMYPAKLNKRPNGNGHTDPPPADTKDSLIPSYATLIEDFAEMLRVIRLDVSRKLANTTVNLSAIDNDLIHVETALRLSIPVICPVCQGDDSHWCALCDNRGWVAKSEAEYQRRQATRKADA